MKPDYVIFVFPRPWAWLSIVLCVISMALVAWITWRQHQARRLLLKLGDSYIAVCEQYGLTEPAEQVRRDLAPLRRQSWVPRRKVPR